MTVFMDLLLVLRLSADKSVPDLTPSMSVKWPMRAHSVLWLRNVRIMFGSMVAWDIHGGSVSVPSILTLYIREV